MPCSLARLLVATLLLAAAPLASPDQGPDEPAPAPSSGVAAGGLGDLRGVYLHSGEADHPEAGVGRLALQLVMGGTEREVSRQHRFSSGDRFRFLVSANREGWLYVLHRSAESPARVLWPPSPGAPGDPGPGANRLRPRAAMPVPTPPAVFVFDQEIGTEYFFVAILPEPDPAILSLLEAPAQEQASALPAQPEAPPASPQQGQTPAAPGPLPGTEPRIVQFSVRGIAGGVSIPRRGVFIDPNPRDSDPATYFSVLPQDLDGGLVFEFRLRHED